MKVVLTKKAEKQLRELPKLDQIAIAKKIRTLTLSSPTNTKKLVGHEDIFRARVENYRIVYKKTPKKIVIVLIGHRKEIYKLVRRVL